MDELEGLLLQARRVTGVYLTTRQWAHEMRRFALRSEADRSNREKNLADADQREALAQDNLSQFVEQLRNSSDPHRIQAMELILNMLQTHQYDLSPIVKNIMSHLIRELNLKNL